MNWHCDKCGMSITIGYGLFEKPWYLIACDACKKQALAARLAEREAQTPRNFGEVRTH